MFIDKVEIIGKIEKDLYLNEIPAINHLKKVPIVFTSPVTFFAGENGTGKSSVIEAIAIASKFNPEGGTKNYSFSTAETHSELWKRIRISKTVFFKWGYFLRAESFYNAANYYDNLEENQKKFLMNLSHGESFLSVLEDNITSEGLYIFDEPEAALSPMKLLSLMVLIDKAVKYGSQFIIATHSPMLMTFPNSKLLYFTDKGIEEIPYYETEHYFISKQLLNSPDKIFKSLFDDDID